MNVKIIIASCVLGALSFASSLPTPDNFIVTHRTVQEKTLWAGWKQRYAVHLIQGTIIRDPASKQVFSEAMGHALLLAVQYNDEVFFNKILDGLIYFKNKNNLYAWKINPDGTKISGYEQTASETEINVLFALLQAQRLKDQRIWVNNRHYDRISHALENNVWTNEILDYNGRLLLLPSDEKANPYWPIVYQGKTVLKVALALTYLNPAFMMEFAKAFPYHPWKQLTDTAYEISNTVLSRSDALLRNSAGIKGSNPVPACVWISSPEANTPLEYEGYYEQTYNPYSNEFDSIRIPMYLGLDYLWNQNDLSKKYIQEFVKLSKVDSPKNARVGAMPEYPTGWNNLLSISQYGVAFKVVGQDKPFKEYTNASLHPSGRYFEDTPQYYYNQTFCLYGYLILNNRFVKVL